MHTATATEGRNGRIVSNNGVLVLEEKPPKALVGTNNNYANPEMLFAGGYAACFDSALNFVMRQQRIRIAGSTSETAEVSMGKQDSGSIDLAVTLSVNVPKVSLEQAQELVEKAHQVCPYSKQHTTISK